MLLKHMSFSSGMTSTTRLVTSFLRILSSGSLAPVSNIPIMVSTIEDLCYFLTWDFQTGIHFPILGFCVHDSSHSRWYTKGPTRRNGTVTQALCIYYIIV